MRRDLAGYIRDPGRFLPRATSTPFELAAPSMILGANPSSRPALLVLADPLQAGAGDPALRLGAQATPTTSTCTGPPPPGVPDDPRARPCPLRSLSASPRCLGPTRLQRWFRDRIAAQTPVGGGYLRLPPALTQRAPLPRPPRLLAPLLLLPVPPPTLGDVVHPGVRGVREERVADNLCLYIVLKHAL